MKYDIVKLMARRKIRWKKRWVSGDSGGRLTFRSKKAGRLSDYRIYGNTVGGESVGDLVESGEHAGEYKADVTVSNGTDTLTTPIYLTEQIKKVGDEAEYIDYGEQKQYRVRKNLLKNTATSQTVAGVTFTVNSDGSVTLDGECTSGAYVRLIDYFDIPAGTYTLTGAPSNSSQYSNFCIYLQTRNENPIHQYVDAGDGITFSVNDTTSMALYVALSPHEIYDFKIYPMIRKADITDDTYEPYIENTEVDITLRALPAQSMSNSLSFGTSVQPSSVAVDVGEIVSCGEKVTDSQSVNYGKYKIPVQVEGKNLVTSYLVELNGGIQFHPVVFAEVNLQPNTEYLITFTVHENGVKLYSNDLLFTSVYYSSEIQGKKTMRLKTKTGIRADQHINNKGWVLLRNAKQNPSDFTITDVKLQLVSDVPIYLDEPLAKSGNNADYIDYATQKRHNSDGTESNITLPKIAVTAGTNTLTVGTAVQPSRVEVKGRIKAVGQETEPEPEPEPEAAEPEAAEPEPETAEAEQETAEAEQETAEAEQE